MTVLKKKTRKRFTKQVRKLVTKYGSQAVTSMVTGVIEATNTHEARATMTPVKRTKKRKLAIHHTIAPAV